MFKLMDKKIVSYPVLLMLFPVLFLEFLEDDEIVLGEVPCEDVDLPSLNESFDIESSLGSLHLNSSTPLKHPV